MNPYENGLMIMNDHPKKKTGTIFDRSASQKFAAAVPLAWRQLVVKPMIVEPLPATPAVKIRLHFG